MTKAADPVVTLKGVGPVRAERLARLGVHTVGDLLALQPLRLELPGEPREPATATTVEEGARVRVSGRVSRPSFFRRGRRDVPTTRERNGEIAPVLGRERLEGIEHAPVHAASLVGLFEP